MPPETRSLQDHATRRYACKGDRCHAEATCMPRLFINPHPMSINAKAEPFSAFMGLPLCDDCFFALRPGMFVEGERNEKLREDATMTLRKRNALPDFDNAKIGRVTKADEDWAAYGRMLEKTRPT